MKYYRYIILSTALVLLFTIGIIKIAHSNSQVVLGKMVSITPSNAGNIMGMGVMWAYAHPTDGRHLMVCGMIQAPKDSVVAGYAYSSGDAGSTWHRTMLENSTRFMSEENCSYGEGNKA